MFKHILLRRSLMAGLAIGAASFPPAAQARLNLNPQPAPASGALRPSGAPPSQTDVISSGPGYGLPTQAASPAALPQPGTTDESGFEWGDAGIGAAGMLVLVGAGTGTATVVRRKRAHRALAG